MIYFILASNSKLILWLNRIYMLLIHASYIYDMSNNQFLLFSYWSVNSRNKLAYNLHSLVLKKPRYKLHACMHGLWSMHKSGLNFTLFICHINNKIIRIIAIYPLTQYHIQFVDNMAKLANVDFKILNITGSNYPN